MMMNIRSEEIDRKRRPFTKNSRTFVEKRCLKGDTPKKKNHSRFFSGVHLNLSFLIEFWYECTVYSRVWELLCTVDTPRLLSYLFVYCCSVGEVWPSSLSARVGNNVTKQAPCSCHVSDTTSCTYVLWHKSLNSVLCGLYSFWRVDTNGTSGIISTSSTTCATMLSHFLEVRRKLRLSVLRAAKETLSDLKWDLKWELK